MKFKAGPPKSALSVSVAELIGLTTPKNKPTAAKTVGGGTVLVYMSGNTNYYTDDKTELRDWLWTHYNLEP